MDPATLSILGSTIPDTIEGIFDTIGTIIQARSQRIITEELGEQAEDLFLYQQAMEQERSKRIIVFVLLAVVVGLITMIALKKKA